MGRNDLKLIYSEIEANLVLLYYRFRYTHCEIEYRYISKSGFWFYEIVNWEYGSKEILYKNYK